MVVGSAPSQTLSASSWFSSKSTKKVWNLLINFEQWEVSDDFSKEKVNIALDICLY